MPKRKHIELHIVFKRLRKSRLKVIGSTRLPDGHGYQLHLKNETVIDYYDNGNYQVQGKIENRPVVELALAGDDE